MPSVNFKKQFAHLVRTGAKTTTIRARQFQPGDKLHLFTGPRYGPKERLGLGIVQSSRYIAIDSFGVPRLFLGLEMEWQDETQRETIAKADGFESFEDMVAFFRSTYPDQPHLHGYLTTWTLHKAP